MATYEDIRAYFDRSSELQAVAAAAARVPIVTGFTLDIDPLWSFLYDVNNDLELRHTTSEAQWGLLYHDLVIAPNTPFPDRPRRGYRRRDLSWNGTEWKDATEHFHKNTHLKRLPLVMTIVHRPLRARRAEETAEDDMSLLRQLVRTTQEAGIAVRIEERPRARLTLASGDQITSSSTRWGTLGGVLDDKAHGIAYGITCSHVAQNGEDVYDVAGNHIGACTADSARVTIQGVCDPVNLASPNPVPNNGPDVNMLDCALIKLTTTVARPTISGVAQALSPGQSVTVTGAVTSKTRHWLGSLCLSYGFSDGTQQFCFRDATNLYLSRAAYLAGLQYSPKGIRAVGF